MQKILDNFEEFLGAVFLAMMVTISFVNVLTRYFFRFSMAFTEELTLYMFVWATMLGVSIAFKHGGNMVVTLIYDRFPKPVRRILYVFSMLLCVVFFLALMYWGMVEVRDEMQMGVITEAMGLPVFYFTISMPVLSVVTIGRILVRLKTDLTSGNF